MEELEIIQQIRKLKGAIRPEPHFVKRGRNVLMAEITSSRLEREKVVPRVFYWFKALHFQTVAVIVFVFLIGAGGVVAAREARQSLPGDRLYVVKRTAFQASQLIPRSEEARLQSEFQFVNKTIDELNFVATQDVNDSSSARYLHAYRSVVADTARDVKKFHQNLSEAQAKRGRQVAGLAKQVTKDSKTLIQNLDAVALEMPAVAREVADARVLVQQTDVTAMKVVAESASEDPSAGEELKDIVQQRLLTLAQQAADLQTIDPEGKDAFQSVHDDIKAAQELVLDGQYEAAVGRVDTALSYLTQRQRALLEEGGGKVISAPLDDEVKGVKTTDNGQHATDNDGVSDAFVGTSIQSSTSTLSTTPEVIEKKQTSSTTVKTVRPVETPQSLEPEVPDDEVIFSIGE